MMKIAICGPGRSGKDTVAEWLRDHAGMRYTAGTSWWAAPQVFKYMKRHGRKYASIMECWQDRHNHRQLWARIIGQINRNDPVRLYRECLAEQDLLTGLRWRREVRAVRAAGLVDLWLWVARSGHYDPTQQYGPEECDLMLWNDGTLDQLDTTLRRFCAIMRIPLHGN